MYMDITKAIANVLNDITLTEADKESIKGKYSNHGIPVDKVVEIIKLLMSSVIDEDNNIDCVIHCGKYYCGHSCPLWDSEEGVPCVHFSDAIKDYEDCEE